MIQSSGVSEMVVVSKFPLLSNELAGSLAVMVVDAPEPSGKFWAKSVTLSSPKNSTAGRVAETSLVTVI